MESGKYYEVDFSKDTSNPADRIKNIMEMIKNSPKIRDHLMQGCGNDCIICFKIKLMGRVFAFNEKLTNKKIDFKAITEKEVEEFFLGMIL